MSSRKKPLLVALLVCTLSVGVRAENIQLADGQVLTDARILSQSGTRVTLRYSQGLISVLKTNLPENLRSQYPVFADKPAEARKPSSATPVKNKVTTKEEPASNVVVDPGAEEALKVEQEKARASGAAYRLAYQYFDSRYKMAGARMDTSIKMEEPTPVQGWTGKWRLHGFATLRQYRDADANPNLAERERQLSKNTALSGKQISRMLANESFIRSEIVEFGAEVDKLDAEPEISVSIR